MPGKRCLTIVSVAMAILALSIFVSAEIFSGVIARIDSSRKPNVQTAKAVKETNISFTGIVKENTDTKITVERTVKAERETLEFVLDKAVDKVKEGDKVKVSYIKKEGQYIAKRIVPVFSKSTARETTRFNIVQGDAH